MPIDTNVLLLAETGTGKEMFANAIHSGSKRRDKPFIAINCSAFGKDFLKKSGLFGPQIRNLHRRNKKGLIEPADEGTFSLDKIGEVDIGLQAKFLQCLFLKFTYQLIKRLQLFLHKNRLR